MEAKDFLYLLDVITIAIVVFILSFLIVKDGVMHWKHLANTYVHWKDYDLWTKINLWINT